MVPYTPSSEAVRRSFGVNATVIENGSLSTRRHADGVSYKQRGMRGSSIETPLPEVAGVTVLAPLRDQRGLQPKPGHRQPASGVGFRRPPGSLFRSFLPQRCCYLREDSRPKRGRDQATWKVEVRFISSIHRDPPRLHSRRVASTSTRRQSLLRERSDWLACTASSRPTARVRPASTRPSLGVWELA